MSTPVKPATPVSTPSYTVPLITVTILFGIFGFLTNLNSNLMPDLKKIFDLFYGSAMLATAAWFFAYLIFPVPSARLIESAGWPTRWEFSMRSSCPSSATCM